MQKILTQLLQLSKGLFVERVWDTTKPETLSEWRTDEQHLCLINQTPLRCLRTGPWIAGPGSLLTGYNQSRCVQRKLSSAPGPDGIPGYVLKVCAEQPAQVFTNIKTSLLQTHWTQSGNSKGSLSLYNDFKLKLIQCEGPNSVCMCVYVHTCMCAHTCVHIHSEERERQ